jgi:phytoene dehydrogenase-like protein
MTASPRTFERYTGRPGGLVGGVPRRAGLHNYAGAWPRPLAPGLWLVGDSVFPGQSTVATALGGLRTAAALAGALGLSGRALRG